jgi:hypothetical protein
LDPALPTRRAFISKFSKSRFDIEANLKAGRSGPFNSCLSLNMKNHHLSFVQKLRQFLRSIVRESAYRHDPLLINSLAAFNFRPLLEFPGELLARCREFAQ